MGWFTCSRVHPLWRMIFFDQYLIDAVLQAQAVETGLQFVFRAEVFLPQVAGSAPVGAYFVHEFIHDRRVGFLESVRLIEIAADAVNLAGGDAFGRALGVAPGFADAMGHDFLLLSGNGGR
ncbi:MAG: hypothetical protein LBT97_02355 [Planctomycetota bacterium]|nr:hypothetical protein [Planctomycetota bacterium]